jgi:hypothetical protein
MCCAEKIKKCFFDVCFSGLFLDLSLELGLVHGLKRVEKGQKGNKWVDLGVEELFFWSNFFDKLVLCFGQCFLTKTLFH